MRLLLLALLGCSAPAEEDTFTPSPYLPDEQTPPVPAYTADEIGMAIEEAIDGLLTLHAQPVLTAYQEARAGEDGYCPRYYEGDAGYYGSTNVRATTVQNFRAMAFILRMRINTRRKTTPMPRARL